MDAEEWAAALFDDAPVGVALFDADRRFVYVNQALAAINRLPAGDHLGRDPLALFGDLVAGWVAEIDEVLRTGIARAPYRYVPVSDPRRAFEVAYYPVRHLEAFGGDRCVVAFVRDVTAAHRDQEWLALLQAASRRLAAADTLPAVARAVADVGAELVGCRASFASVVPDGLRVDAMSGYPPAKEEDWRGRVVPKGQPAMMARAVSGGRAVVANGVEAVARENPGYVESLLEDGISSVACVPILRAGRPVACLTLGMTGDRVFDDALLGAVTTLAGMAATPVERVLRASEREEQRLRAAFDAMLDHVLICRAVRDDDGAVADFEVVFANATAEDPRGRSLQDRHGETILELFPNLADSDVLATLVGVVETRVPFSAEELHYQDSLDGDDVDAWWSVRISPLGDGFIFAGRDVTEAVRARTEAEREREAHRLEREAVKVLQQFALPLRLPSLPGVDLAAAHLPADGQAPLGGDWYDAFTLPDGRLALVIGDVAGHGPEAAHAMVEVRRFLGSLRDDAVTPAAALTLANEHLLAGETSFVTCCYAVVDVAASTVTVSLAGHPPPVLAVEAGGSELLGGHPGVPLGALPDARYCDVTAQIPGPSTLVLYTDGLVERRGEDLAASIAALRATVVAARGDAARICRSLTTALAAGRSDDACVLVVTVDPP